jgi:hypothetical protein
MPVLIEREVLRDHETRQFELQVWNGVWFPALKTSDAIHVRNSYERRRKNGEAVRIVAVVVSTVEIVVDVGS